MRTQSTPSPIQQQQNKRRFVSTEGFLSYELGKAISKPSPLFTRLLSGGISLLFFGTLTWAAVSKIDETATATAEVIPSTRVQPVRSLSGGLLRNVYVKEGQQVQPNTQLVQLDPTISEAEFQRLTQLLKLNKENLARLEAERVGKAQAGNTFQNELLASRLQESQAAIKRQIAVVTAARAELNRLQATLTFANTKKQSLGMLVREGAIPRLDYLDAQSQVASMQAERHAKEQEIAQTEQELKHLQAGRQNEILTQINQMNQEVISLEGQLKQAKEQRDRETIKASVSGTVYNIKISKPGATVQPGDELLSIVPEGEELILEAKVLNRDRGFIHPGMEVKIKLETFPYQEYGLLKGELLEISPNAVSEQDLGLVYSARIRLAQHSMRVKGQEVPLTPGMTATAEIVTRQKTILSFLIEPLVASWDKAFSIR
jgi:HlyD family secretion protein